MSNNEEMDKARGGNLKASNSLGAMGAFVIKTHGLRIKSTSTYYEKNTLTALDVRPSEVRA